MTTAIKERPIIESPESVRAYLEGRKSQTRRVVARVVNEDPNDWRLDRMQCYPDGSVRPVFDHLPSGEPNAVGIPCPYGQPGDRLWVRETWALVPRTAYAASVGVQQTFRPDDPSDAAVYREGWNRCQPGRWRSPIHMPRWAARLTLEITDVRVQRVQEISREDAITEGHPNPPAPKGLYVPVSLARDIEPIRWFADGWDTRHAKRGHGWDANPWVWCITTKLVSPGTEP